MSWGRLLVPTAFTFVATFLFRFLTVEFTNDHFQHLSRGRQILLGDLPVRDFFDPGLILQYYASAAALSWSGHNLYGEALLTVLFVAAGTAAAFAISAQLSRSLWIASAATFIVFLSSPRLYSYPKAFFYVAALVAAWSYAQRPGTARVGVLAALTAVAFLFRHDHGVYIGLAVPALLAILHWHDRRTALRAFVSYAGITILLLVPWLVFVQSAAGLPRYIAGIGPQIDHVATLRFNRLPLAFDGSAPLWVVAPAPERRVQVRWGPALDMAGRRAREARYSLTQGVLVEASTWSYIPNDERRENIRALVDDPVVADTHGIDRPRGEIDIDEPFYVTVERWLPLLRLQLAPGVFTPENRLAWFYYLTFLVPFACFTTLAVLLWRGGIDRAEAAVAGMTAVLSFVIVQTLVRGSPDSRLADVAGPTCVGAAWIAARWLHSVRQRWSARGLAIVGVALSLWLITAWSAGPGFYSGLVASRIVTGPAGMWWQWNVKRDRLLARPIDYWTAQDQGVPALGRYVFECTSDNDRLLVTWFAPEIFFYAERGFAGGQVYLQPRWHASVEDQQLTIERMQRQRVPLVLVRNDRDYRTYFPLVHAHVQRHYTEARPTDDRIEGYSVFVDRRFTSVRMYEPLGLPCFRA